MRELFGVIKISDTLCRATQPGDVLCKSERLVCKLPTFDTLTAGCHISDPTEMASYSDFLAARLFPIDSSTLAPATNARRESELISFFAN